jgi:quinol monooxygenase YgiN
MVGIISRLKVKQGYEAAFEDVLQSLAASVRANEQGNLVYQLCKTPNDRSLYVMIELYSSDDAYAVHRVSAHLQAARAKLSELLTGAPVIEQYDAVL